jgi:hypothetical protein
MMNDYLRGLRDALELCKKRPSTLALSVAGDIEQLISQEQERLTIEASAPAATARKCTPGQLNVLLNLLAGKPPWHHFAGAQLRAATATERKLRRSDLVDGEPMALTQLGLAVATYAKLKTNA